MQQQSIVKIYALTDNKHNIRYVGQTIKMIGDRFREHLNEAKKMSQTPVYRWIRKHKYDINIILLQEDAEWNVDEIKWIDRYKEEGHPLTNATIGGDGRKGYIMPEAVKQKISKSQIGVSCPQRANNYTPELRKKRSDALKGRKLGKQSDWLIAKRSEAIRKSWEKRKQFNSLINAQVNVQ